MVKHHPLGGFGCYPPKEKKKQEKNVAFPWKVFYVPIP
jgi:hypothetical protein